jgi:hypothetical protein
MHNCPTSGHFVDEEGNESKPVYIKSYTNSMDFVNLSDMMAKSYSIFLKIWSGLKSLLPPNQTKPNQT